MTKTQLKAATIARSYQCKCSWNYCETLLVQMLLELLRDLISASAPGIIARPYQCKCSCNFGPTAKVRRLKFQINPVNTVRNTCYHSKFIIACCESWNDYARLQNVGFLQLLFDDNKIIMTRKPERIQKESLVRCTAGKVKDEKEI